jgi:hypothetical protein
MGVAAMKKPRPRWKYLRIITSHETKTGALRLTDLRIAKVPNDYRRIGVESALFVELFDRYKKRGRQTVGVRETLRLIRVHDVTKALTHDEPKKNIWDSPPYSAPF